MAMNKSDTAILVTAYTGGNAVDPVFENHFALKKLMTKTLCKHLSSSGHYVVLSTHSTVDEETQGYVNTFIYDHDNRWQIDGHPIRPNHGIAELSCIHNAINYLKKFPNIKYILKLCYDMRPDIDYGKVIERSKSHGKSLVAYRDRIGINTMFFFGSTDFFQRTFPLTDIWRCHASLESAWFNSITEKSLMDEVYAYSSPEEHLGLQQGEPIHYSIGGNVITDYNFQ